MFFLASFLKAIEALNTARESSGGQEKRSWAQEALR
jgi:hypothetical protein